MAQAEVSPRLCRRPYCDWASRLRCLGVDPFLARFAARFSFTDRPVFFEWPDGIERSCDMATASDSSPTSIAPPDVLCPRLRLLTWG
jgi:hypothetical protein